MPDTGYKKERLEHALERANELLRATWDILTRCDDSPVVLDVSEVQARYDGTNCDGRCLKDDIGCYLDLSWDTEPKELDSEKP